MADRVAMEKVFLEALRIPPSVSIIPPMTLIFIYMLLLSERQTCDAWEPSKKK